MARVAPQSWPARAVAAGSDRGGYQGLAGVGDDLQLTEVATCDGRRTGDVSGAGVVRVPPAGGLGATVAADHDQAAPLAPRDAPHRHVEPGAVALSDELPLQVDRACGSRGGLLPVRPGVAGSDDRAG